MLATITTKTIRDRWLGVAIGVGTMALLLIFGMAVYRDLDLTLYTDLPVAFRSLFGIAEDTDIAGLAYGAIYSSYGVLVVAGLAISMGSATIAREERNGTMGLLLSNPKSRSQVLISKATAMVLLTTAGVAALWGAGILVPELLGVEVGGIHIGALMFHMLVNALFYGFMAMAIGAWTGKPGMASGITAGIMVISFIAVGLLPLVGGLEDGVKAFPWYYYDKGDPLLNGVDWGGLSVLFAGIGVLAAVAWIGVNRRDLRDREVGITLVDRLRSNPMTQKIVNRLAGSARVSRIWVKTASEHQGMLIVVAYVLVLLGVMLGPMYTAIDTTLARMAGQFPEEILAIAGGGDLTTPEGWYQLEHFGLMVPVGVMVLTIAVGAKALAGEEAQRTMGLLLANPIKRSRIVLEKMFTMVLLAVGVAVVTVAGVAAGSAIAGLGLSVANVAAASLLATLLGLVFGALALALGAATGRVRIAIFGAVGAAVVSHVANSFLVVNAGVAGWAKLTPNYYYLTSDPLDTGMHWGHGAVLAAVAIVLVAASIVLFNRRDLRQTG